MAALLPFTPRRGSNFAGNPAVARRIVSFEDAYPRIFAVGDSLLSTSYSSTDASNTALSWGIMKSWMPKRWSGVGMSPLSQGDAGLWYTFNGAASNHTPGTDSFGLGGDVVPIPCTYEAFGSNLANGTLKTRHYIESTVVSPRYLGDVGWEQRNTAMLVRFIYLRHAAGANMTLQGVRPDGSAEVATGNVDMSGATGIAYSDLTLPDGATDTQPGLRVVARTGIDETGTNLIHVATLVTRADRAGLEYVPGGIGGKTAAEHAGSTLYTQTALNEFVTATGSNVFMICVGANSGLGGSKATYKSNVRTIVEKYRAAAAFAGVVSPQFLLFQPWYNNQNTDADIDTMFEAQAEIANERNDTLAINLAAICGDVDALLIDNIHTSREGSEFAAGMLWRALSGVALSGTVRDFRVRARRLGGVR